MDQQVEITQIHTGYELALLFSTNTVGVKPHRSLSHCPVYVAKSERETELSLRQDGSKIITKSSTI